MTKILVVYATNAGSTIKVAHAVGDGLKGKSVDVEVRAVEQVTPVDEYDTVVVGAPMIFGWHREARAFLQQHHKALTQVPVAYFMVALSLTDNVEETYRGIPIWRDPDLAKPPAGPTALNFRERFTSVTNYVQPAFQSAPEVTPVSIAFFNGMLDYGRLNLFERWFVRLVFNAPEGDFRNWDAIRAWGESISANLVNGV